MERISIGVYWEEKKETIISLSKKLYKLFLSFHGVDNRFRKLKFATTIKKIDRVLDLNIGEEKYVEKLSSAILEDKRYSIYKYHPGVIPTVDFHEPLGFVIGFEGIDIKNLQITFVAGAYDENLPGNNMLMKFPPDYQYNFDEVYSLFKIMVDNFNPDWGAVMNRRFTELISAQKPPEIFVGWMNYFKRSDIIEIPADYKQEEYHGGIMCFTTNYKEIFSIDNKAHMEKTFKLIEHFRKKMITRNSFS